MYTLIAEYILLTKNVYFSRQQNNKNKLKVTAKIL